MDKINDLLAKAETLAIDIHQRECGTEPRRDQTIEDASEIVQAITDARKIIGLAKGPAPDFLGDKEPVTNYCPVCEARPKEGWVSVEERLPDTGVRVWIAVRRNINDNFPEEVLTVDNAGSMVMFDDIKHLLEPAEGLGVCTIHELDSIIEGLGGEGHSFDHDGTSSFITTKVLLMRLRELATMPKLEPVEGLVETVFEQEYGNLAGLLRNRASAYSMSPTLTNDFRYAAYPDENCPDMGWDAVLDKNAAHKIEALESALSTQAAELERLREERDKWRKIAVENVIPLEAIVAADEYSDPLVRALSPTVEAHVKERITETRAALGGKE